MKTGTETLVTLNSTYEIDYDLKRVRRIEGVNPPTGRFEADGVWHEFDSVSDTYWGGVVFYWPEGTCTVTSAKGYGTDEDGVPIGPGGRDLREGLA